MIGLTLAAVLSAQVTVWIMAVMAVLIAMIVGVCAVLKGTMVVLEMVNVVQVIVQQDIWQVMGVGGNLSHLFVVIQDSMLDMVSVGHKIHV